MIITKTLKDQINEIKKAKIDMHLKVAILQSLEVLRSDQDPDDNCVVARLSEDRARKFNEFLNQE